MFKIFFKKEKPRIFLGSLSVVPRTDFKKVDEWGLFQNEDIDTEFRRELEEIFILPLVSDIENPLSSDLVLDVIITKYQLGDAYVIDLWFLGIPILWRPKVEVKSRLYSLKTNKTKKVFSATENMKWLTFFNRIFSWRFISRLRPPFDRSDIRPLLYKACHKLLLEMRESA